MLSVRPRELRLVIKHHQAAMMMINCTRLSSIVYRLLVTTCTCRPLTSLGGNLSNTAYSEST